MSASSDPYRIFARFYDAEFDSFTDDLDLYRQFAIEANGPILELGCGSGRVLAALVGTGLPLTGIDSSPAMLAAARKRLGSSASLIQGQMEDVGTLTSERGPFWLAFAAINTFLHLPDSEAQVIVLEALRDVVVPGGLLLLDLFVPDPLYLASLDSRLTHEFSGELPTDERFDKWVVRSHDPALQLIETSVWFDVSDGHGGSVSRYSDRYSTRYIYRFELEHLLARCGWNIVSLFGSYELEGYSSESERMIVLATWGEMEGTGEGPSW